MFSSAKLTDMDIALGPEMKSTGEVLGIDKDLDKAIYKGFLGAGMSIPTNGNVFVTLKESEQNTYTADILRDYAEAGFRLYATDDTIEFIMAHDIPVEPMDYVTAQKWIMNHDSESDEKDFASNKHSCSCEPKGKRKLPGKTKGYRERHLGNDMHGYGARVPEGCEAQAAGCSARL